MALGNLTSCRLPGGYIDENGKTHRDALLVPLSGREEEYLADGNLAGAAATTYVLSRCVERIGGINPVTEDVARRLLVADRQFLLMKLRQITFGDRVGAVLRCPWPDCGNRLDVDFFLSGIPVVESGNKGPVFSMKLSREAMEAGMPPGFDTIVFRLPNGEDQEAVLPLLAVNEAQALSALLARCLAASGPGESPGSDMVAKLSPLARQEIEAEMDRVSPKVEMTMETRCPECGRAFPAPFDLQDFFFGEMRISRDLLYREVHCLAYHYHWSERDIMDMSREKRRRYIDVLAGELEKMNEGF